MSKKSFGLKNFFFSFVMVCIVIYIFKNFNDSVDTIVAEKGSMEDIIEAKGIVVKDEEVFSASIDGNITYYHSDGERINKGLLVADIHTDLNSTQIKNQITEIQAAIDLKSSNEALAKEQGDTLITNEEMTVFQNDIQTSILNNNLEDMYNVIGQVNNNGIQSSSSNKYDSYEISDLKSMISSLSKGLETNKMPYYSQKSGIITYRIDGLEESYKYENALALTPSNTVPMDYIETDSSKDSTVSKGDKLYKIIKNFDYYIAATVTNEYVKLFEENKYIKTRFKYDGLENEVWGYIKKINYGSENSVLIIYCDDYFYKIYDKRYVDLELITDIHEGIKIDTKALIQKDGITGVYVKDASNIVKFFPVEILGEYSGTSTISTGSYVSENQRRVINVLEKSYETIKIFDKIILEPDKVYEGQIIE